MYRNNNGKQIKMTEAEIDTFEKDLKIINEDFAKVREAKAEEVKNQISGNKNFKFRIDTSRGNSLNWI